MKKQMKLEAAVLAAKSKWRKVCAAPGSTADDRHRAFAAWKKAESVRNKALLLWKTALAERRRAAADRRKAHLHAEWLKNNADRRKRARRP